MEHSQNLRLMVRTALFIALIIAGAYIAIPIGPVPIVLQNMFVLMAGIVLGPVWGLVCVGTYLLIGLMGLPVFAGGMSGVGRIFGPTGGYLIGYLPAVFITAIVSRQLKNTVAGNVLALIAGTAIIYAAGVPWLKVAMGLSWKKTLAAGMFPFLIGDVLKIAATAIIVRKLSSVFNPPGTRP